MHIPKSGGTSVLVALVAALPGGSVSTKRFDTSVFCAGFRDVDAFPEQVRRLVAHSDEEFAAMVGSPVVGGHFCLATLERLTSSASIATTLREPVARLLSLYSFWRLVAEDPGAWPPYVRHASRPLEEYLAEPAIAAVTDNTVCRMLLDDGATIAPDQFIPAERIPLVASTAIQRLDTLGCVCTLESGSGMWRALSDFFGVTVQPRREAVTSALTGTARRRPMLRARAVDLLGRRTAADAIVYEHAVARRDRYQRREATTGVSPADARTTEPSSRLAL